MSGTTGWKRFASRDYVKSIGGATYEICWNGNWKIWRCVTFIAERTYLADAKRLAHEHARKTHEQ